MVRNSRSREPRRAFRLPIRSLPVSMMMLVLSGAPLPAQNPSDAITHVTHILGFADAANNASGDLSIHDGALQFQKKDAAQSARIDVASIQDVVLGQEDKQVGGTAAAVGRAATPYGGGRVIALFSHKKYDTVTLEYLDSNGGFHGAIFQLDKGQGAALKNQLVAGGAHLKPTNPETKNESK